MTNLEGVYRAEIDAEDMAAERVAIDQIEPLNRWREAERFAKREVDQLDPKGSGGRFDYGSMGPLRRWLTDHEDESLLDQEHGLEASLKSGGEELIFDRPSAVKERDPQFYRRGEELGLFRWDPEAVKQAIAEGLVPANFGGFVHKGQRTPRLVIEKVKD